MTGVKITLLPSAYPGGNGLAYQFATSYLVNESIAIDAGCLGFCGEPDDQLRIKHILISHSHMDHVASLPIFVENVYSGSSDCVTVYGNEAVLDSLQRDVFNSRVWPDFVAMSSPGAAAPFLRLEVLKSGHPRTLDGLVVRPVTVDHVVPTHGFLLSDEAASVVISSDTGPTEAIWREAHALPNLKAIFLEVTFPNSMQRLADVSMHLTPSTLAEEIQKMPAGVPVYAVHLKARFREAVRSEVAALKIPHLHIASFDTPYEW